MRKSERVKSSDPKKSAKGRDSNLVLKVLKKKKKGKKDA